MRLGAVLLAVGFAACADKGFGNVSVEDAPGTISDTVCEQAEGCGCFEGVQITVDSCKMQYSAEWESIIAQGEAAGLTYDGACVGRMLDAFADVGCATSVDDEDLGGIGGCAPCKFFHGEKGVGDPCQEAVTGYGDDCAQGLSCDVEQCVDPCATVGEGEDCSTTACEDGLYCNVSFDPMTEEQTMTCVRPAGEGEDCMETPCGEGLLCDVETFTCQPTPPPPGEGEPCMGVCAEGNYCDTSEPDPTAWVCRAQKGDDEPCESDEECLSWQCEEGACVPESPIVCFF